MAQLKIELKKSSFVQYQPDEYELSVDYSYGYDKTKNLSSSEKKIFIKNSIDVLTKELIRIELENCRSEG